MALRRTNRLGVRVSSESHGSTLIAKPEGRIDGTNAHQFKRLMEVTVADSSGTVIINCMQLQEVTSAGLSAFLMVARMLEKQDTVFAVCSLSPRIAEIFRVTGFDQIIPICGSREEAYARIEG